jgi:hypothetical protein
MTHKNVLIFLFLILIAACSRKEAGINARSTQIQILNPTSESVYFKGDTIRIQGLITHTSFLHGYSVIICSPIDTHQNYFVENKHVHTDSIFVNTFWVDTLKNEQKLKLIIRAFLDHDGNSLESHILLQHNEK